MVVMDSRMHRSSVIHLYEGVYCFIEAVTVEGNILLDVCVSVVEVYNRGNELCYVMLCYVI